MSDTAPIDALVTPAGPAAPACECSKILRICAVLIYFLGVLWASHLTLIFLNWNKTVGQIFVQLDVPIPLLAQLVTFSWFAAAPLALAAASGLSFFLLRKPAARLIISVLFVIAMHVLWQLTIYGTLAPLMAIQKTLIQHR
jgi:hypothetical protein